MRTIILIALFALSTNMFAQKKYTSAVSKIIVEQFIQNQFDSVPAKWMYGFKRSGSSSTPDSRGYAHGYFREYNYLSDGYIVYVEEIMYTDLKGKILSFSRNNESVNKFHMEISYSLHKAEIQRLYGKGNSSNNWVNHHGWYGYVNEQLYDIDIFFYKHDGKFTSSISFHLSEEKISQ